MIPDAGLPVTSLTKEGLLEDGTPFIFGVQPKGDLIRSERESGIVIDANGFSVEHVYFYQEIARLQGIAVLLHFKAPKASLTWVKSRSVWHLIPGGRKSEDSQNECHFLLETADGTPHANSFGVNEEGVILFVKNPVRKRNRRWASPVRMREGVSCS